MTKQMVSFILLVTLFLAACVPPVPATALTPTATPTLTWSAPALTREAGGDGYALEFTHQVSGGFATLHASAHTCSGIGGPWDGTFDVELDYDRLHVSGSGPFAFTLPADSLTVQGEAPFSGSGTVSGSSCGIILGVSDPLQFEISFNADSHSAAIIMGSTGAGNIAIANQCSNSPVVTIPFAIVWGPEPLIVPITPYNGCPQP